MKESLICLFACLLTAGPLAAQQNEDSQPDNAPQEEPAADEESNALESEGNQRFWQADLTGGKYMVALDRISSVSMHQYVLDTQLLITEVVVDTNGRALTRFYHIASVAEGTASALGGTAAQRGADLLDRAGQKAGTDIHNLAQKNYPATSHAGMVEFRILDQRDLEAIFRSLQGAWESGKGRKITIH